MKFNDWLKQDEALLATLPPKIEELDGVSVDDMSPQQLLLLAKWHGIEPTDDLEQLKFRIRNSRQQAGDNGRTDIIDPSPYDVRKRVHSNLLKQGRYGDRWLPRKRF